MFIRNALVVEDDPKMLPILTPIFKALKHSFEVAGSLEGAREKLNKREFDYGVFDLTIPADEEGDFPDKQYGIILIREVRESKEKDEFPIISMTSYAEEGFGLSTELHEIGVNACVPKNVAKMERLLQTINTVLEKQTPGRASTNAVATGPKKLAPFSARLRELVVYDDQITVCGVRVWTETSSDDMRAVIMRLKENTKDGYDHVEGRVLMKLLDRPASNPIARRIKDFRDTASEALREHRFLECGPEDIICARGGYHLQPWVKVKVVDGPKDERAHQAQNEPESEPVNEPGQHGAKRKNEPREPLNERQKWITEQLENGVELRLVDILKHTHRDRSTINRDLKDLRLRGLIETHNLGHYVKAKQKA